MITDLRQTFFVIFYAHIHVVSATIYNFPSSSDYWLRVSTLVTEWLVACFPGTNIARGGGGGGGG